MTTNNKFGKRIVYITFITFLDLRHFCRLKRVTRFKERHNGIILLPFGGTEETHRISHSVEGVFIDFDRTLVVRRTTQLEQRIITTGQVVRLSMNTQCPNKWMGIGE